jgi:serine/threonine-protein kinase
VPLLVAAFVSMHVIREMGAYGHVTDFGPYIVVLAMFPLMHHGPLRATSIAATVAVATVPVVGASTGYAIGLPVPAGQLVEMTIPAAATAALTVISARVLYRLRFEASSAQRLGPYELESRLGQGGMGNVWAATHRLLKRRAAVKLIRPKRMTDQGRALALRRFQREAMATAALESAHTVRLFDFGVTEDQTFYYVMELLDGLDLGELVDMHGPQPAARVIAILEQACESLAEAHQRGLVHRDVKPANLMICQQGVVDDFVKVLDFGLVTLQADLTTAETEHAATEPGTLIGTPAFMAPEAVRGAVDPRSDLYSLGCVAYWLLTGQRVFEYGSVALQAAAHVEEVPASLSRHGVSVSPDLEGLVMELLRKDPEARPQTAMEVLYRLEECSDHGRWGRDEAEQWWFANRGSRDRPGSQDSTVAMTTTDPGDSA